MTGYRHVPDGTPLWPPKFRQSRPSMTWQPSGAAGLFTRQEPCAPAEQFVTKACRRCSSRAVCVRPLAPVSWPTRRPETVQSD